MRVLVFGQTGQVARELARRVPAGVTVDFLGRDRADLSDPAACAALIAGADADVVINAAAWTAVDKAESEEASATVVNADAPAAIARACAAVPGLNAWYDSDSQSRRLFDHVDVGLAVELADKAYELRRRGGWLTGEADDVEDADHPAVGERLDVDESLAVNREVAGAPALKTIEFFGLGGRPGG